MTPRRVVGALAFLTLLVGVATAAAQSGKGEQRKFNAADQAAARAATLKRTDLKPTVGWKGGSVKPDLSPPPPCPNYEVDLSSFVMTGAAETKWTLGPAQIDSEAQLFETPATVAQEWKLQVASSKAMACYRVGLRAALAASGATLVSFKKVSFPHVAPFTAAFVVGATASSQGVSVPIAVELVFLGKGRTEVALSLSGLGTGGKTFTAAAVRYARILVSRIRA